MKVILYICQSSVFAYTNDGSRWQVDYTCKASGSNIEHLKSYLQRNNKRSITVILDLPELKLKLQPLYAVAYRHRRRIAAKTKYFYRNKEYFFLSTLFSVYKKNDTFRVMFVEPTTLSKTLLDVLQSCATKIESVNFAPSLLENYLSMFESSDNSRFICCLIGDDSVRHCLIRGGKILFLRTVALTKSHYCFDEDVSTSLDFLKEQFADHTGIALDASSPQLFLDDRVFRVKEKSFTISHEYKLLSSLDEATSNADYKDTDDVFLPVPVAHYLALNRSAKYSRAQGHCHVFWNKEKGCDLQLSMKTKWQMHAAVVSILILGLLYLQVQVYQFTETSKTLMDKQLEIRNALGVQQYSPELQRDASQLVHQLGRASGNHIDALYIIARVVAKHPLIQLEELNWSYLTDENQSGTEIRINMNQSTPMSRVDVDMATKINDSALAVIIRGVCGMAQHSVGLRYSAYRDFIDELIERPNWGMLQETIVPFDTGSVASIVKDRSIDSAGEFSVLLIVGGEKGAA